MSASSPAARIQANLQELFQSKSTSGTPHVKFQLTSEMFALLSMERVQETLIVQAGQITLLPSMPTSALGIMNARDRVFCVFDLAQLLGLPVRLAVPRHYQVIVLQTTGSTPMQIGFTVNNLQGIVRLTAEQIRAASDAVSPKIKPYTFGEVATEQGTIPILAFERIMDSIAV